MPEKPGKPCPLCGTILTDGRKVSSILYPGKPDGMMEIHGCPFCMPPAGTTSRLCPVCGKEIPADGYVIARVFSGSGKTHVHVLGCTGCYARKRPGQRG
jgi:predicted nucleic acid-binding Zn ribbon protein